MRLPAFTHGKFYVAFSRTGIPDQLHIAIQPRPNQDHNSTPNPVYYGVLLHESDDLKSDELTSEDILPQQLDKHFCNDEIDDNIEGYFFANDLPGAELEDDIEFWDP